MLSAQNSISRLSNIKVSLKHPYAHLRPPVLWAPFTTSSSESIFIITRQPYCVWSQGSNIFLIKCMSSFCPDTFEASRAKREPIPWGQCGTLSSMCQHTIYQSPLLSPGSQNGKTIPDQDHGAHPLVYESPLHHGQFYPDCWIIFSIHGCVFHGVHW